MNCLFHYSLFLFTLMALTGCTTTSPLPISWQSFTGRDNGLSLNRPLLYRACVPAQWIRHDPPLTESIADTMRAICEFYIHDRDQSIRITLHTFPILQETMRIPPHAQIQRWKGQFEELDVLTVNTLPEAQGGFSGLFFEGEGKMQGKEMYVMGWSMQLAPLYERQLAQGKHPLDQSKRADYTIKASGPPSLMRQYRADILSFAHSFELIDELPTSL